MRKRIKETYKKGRKRKKEKNERPRKKKEIWKERELTNSQRSKQ